MNEANGGITLANYDEVARHVDEQIRREGQARNKASWSAAALIRLAKEHPPEPILEGLLNVGDTLLMHGTEESRIW